MTQATAMPAQGAYMDLSAAELTGIITAGGVAAAGAFKGIGALAKWMFASRVSREEWVEKKVRAAFADIERTAAAANLRADNLAKRIDALESDKLSLLAVSQALVFELGKFDPNSTVLFRAQHLLNKVQDDGQPKEGFGL